MRFSQFKIFASDTTNASNHFKALDGLRGMAVLFVLLSHSSLSDVFIFPGINFERIGKTGVFLFFVLSAYLLDRQIIKAFLSNKATWLYWANYFLRRFLRIYPLFVIALIVFWSIGQFGIKSPIEDIKSITEHLLLMKGEGIFWSIAVEFKYYFVSPFIMAACNYFFKWDIKKVGIFIGAIIGLSIFLQWRFNFSEISLIRYLPIFLTGTLLSIFEALMEQGKHQLNHTQISEWTAAIALVLIILTFPHLFNFAFNQNFDLDHFHDPAFYLPFSLLWATVLIGAKYGKAGWLRKFFELKMLRFLGLTSFSAYLFHILILKAVQLKPLGIDTNFQFYVFMFFTCIVAFTSYILIEKPLSAIRIIKAPATGTYFFSSSRIKTKALPKHEIIKEQG